MKSTATPASQATLLARMAATRAELVAANHVSALVASARRGIRAPVIQTGPIFLQTPYAGLIAAALVVSVILGPTHLVKIAARRGLTPWIARTLRTLVIQ